MECSPLQDMYNKYEEELEFSNIIETCLEYKLGRAPNALKGNQLLFECVEQLSQLYREFYQIGDKISLSEYLEQRLPENIAKVLSEPMSRYLPLIQLVEETQLASNTEIGWSSKRILGSNTICAGVCKDIVSLSFRGRDQKPFIVELSQTDLDTVLQDMECIHSELLHSHSL